MKKQKEREEKLKDMLIKNKGITLIALVITIVVLIILATISINAVLGDNGLIKQAEKASQMQANAEASDNDAMGILDKYIEDASAVKKEPGLQIAYSTEDIGSNAKVINLSYSIGTGEGATAEQIEAKIEELTGMTITDELRDEAKKEANTIGITYEEYLLEMIGSIELEMEITEELRAGLQEQATSVGMTYKEFLEYALEEECGITFGESLVSVEELENLCKEKLNLEITDELRTSLQEQATSAEMTYREYLEYALNENGVDTSGVTVEVSMGNTSVICANSEFIATKNGIYTVKTTAINGMQAETQIDVTGIEEEKFSNIYTTTTTYTDTNGATATIPAGFAVGTSDGINTIANGLVITDAVDSEGYSTGNEFVWIPVESESVLERTLFDSNGQATEGLDTTEHTEPYASGYSDGNGTEEIAEYNEMKTQVLKYNGFYIARYEAGKNTDSTSTQQVVSKRGVVPYYNIAWGSSMSDIGTNGAVYLAQNMYTNSNSVTSTLIYGSQWDAMCRYIGDSNRTTAEKESWDITGKVGDDISKNIYDLAGNFKEWTMESDYHSYVDARTIRGGTFKEQSSIFNRYDGVDIDNSNLENKRVSFRCALYIND